MGEKDQKTNIFVVETVAFSDSRGCKTADMKQGLSVILLDWIIEEQKFLINHPNMFGGNGLM